MSNTKKARTIMDRDYIIGEVDKRLFGSFIEHMGRAVYTGIYEPGHPLADGQGFRGDVIEHVKDLQVPIIRYPGGNFLSGYNWKDGIGSKEKRPTNLDLAWFTTETNEVGIDEFVSWCQKTDAEVMAAVNLGTGTPQEAGELVEYCNHPGGTFWSDQRKKNGYSQPHKIKTWCLGNEMDGPWQICHLSAEDYGKKALETAKIMKWVDPEIELVACGSSGPEMPTFPEWDRIVLEYLYDHVDYISLHRYYELDEEKNVSDFLSSFADMDNFIKAVASTADYVKAQKRSGKTLGLSFDEWNVWYLRDMVQTTPRWRTAPPLLEDNFTLLDALVVGGLLCTLINNSDRVKIACLAQLVNTISPICTAPGGGILKKSTYYPFKIVSSFGRGEALNIKTQAPEMDTKKHGSIPLIQSAAVYDKEADSINLFLLNCDLGDDVELEINIKSFGNVKASKSIILDGPDLFAVNSFNSPDRVKPRVAKIDFESKGDRIIKIPKQSFCMIQFSCEE